VSLILLQAVSQAAQINTVHVGAVVDVQSSIYLQTLLAKILKMRKT
jgi:hypothetical protein